MRRLFVVLISLLLLVCSFPTIKCQENGESAENGESGADDVIPAVGLNEEFPFREDSSKERSPSGAAVVINNKNALTNEPGEGVVNRQNNNNNQDSLEPDRDMVDLQEKNNRRLEMAQEHYAKSMERRQGTFVAEQQRKRTDAYNGRLEESRKQHETTQENLQKQIQTTQLQKQLADLKLQFQTQMKANYCSSRRVANAVTKRDIRVAAVNNLNPSNRPVDTGIDVKKGQSLKISARGVWSATSINDRHDANGKNALWNSNGAGLRTESLVGRIGNGPWFQVGTDFFQCTINHSGRLYLAFWHGGKQGWSFIAADVDFQK